MGLGWVSQIRMFGLVAALLSVGAPSFARDYRPHPGYVDSTLVERGEQASDLQLIEPLPYDGPELKDRIFNETLSKEFQEKYNDKFGRTDAERIFMSPNRTSYYNDVWYQGSQEDYAEERKKFGDYMIKRLAEYHADDFMKNNPHGRSIYAIKESVSNVNVKVSSFQFDMRYEIAGNTADFIVKNPYFKTAKVRLNMNPGAVGPSSVDETIVTLGTEVSPTISFETYYSMPLSNLSLVGRKSLSPALVATVSLVDAQRNLGAVPQYGLTSNWIRETIYLGGLGYTF